MFLIFDNKKLLQKSVAYVSTVYFPTSYLTLSVFLRSDMEKEDRT